MKIKMIALVTALVLGLAVALITLSGMAAVEEEYSTNLAAARYNAQKQIPYNAYNYYLKAFQIRCEDEAVFREYLEQAQLLGGSFYRTAVEQYVEYFPNSPEGNELLCRLHYEGGSYATVLETALAARERGAATEQVRLWYNECAYMLKNLSGGVEEAWPFVGDVAMVKIGGLYGFLDCYGHSLLPAIYTEASPMMGANAAVNDGEEWHIINRGGFKVARTESPVDYMGMLIGGKIPVGVEGRYGYTNTGLQIPQELPYEFAGNFKNGVAAVKKDGKWALIDGNEQPLTGYVFEDVVLDDFQTCYNGGVVFVKKDGKFYMANGQGQKITDTAFDDARPFTGNEPAAVCVDGKWGFVDAAGAWVLQPEYEDADSFGNGLAGVCRDGLWGYINRSGTVMIEYQFEDCIPFNTMGIAAVKENGIWKYVQLLSYYK